MMENKMITLDQLALIGQGHVGYIRRCDEDSGDGFELRDAGGKQLAIAETLEAALFAAQHLEIQPVTLY